MNPSRMLHWFGVTVAVASASMVGVAFGKDLWVHPRSEPFNANVHYKAEDGEVFYKAENDLGKALGDITLERGDRPLVTVTIGTDIFRKITGSKGSLRPMLLWDSDGDGRVDRSARGRLDGDKAIFDSPDLADVNLEITRWQLGVRYIAGSDGEGKLDGRYLASVDSDDANIAFLRDDKIKRQEFAEAAPPVDAPAPPIQPGLVIFKHRADKPFDLAEFAEDPARFIEDFNRLGRAFDGDDWTATGEEGEDGVLMTHFEDEDLFIVRTEGGADLEVEWGDMPLAAFFEFYLEVEKNAKGCYNSLDSKLTQDDGTPVKVPHRFFYCPGESVALIDVPDGYQVGLTALVGNQLIERTDAGNTTMDNVRLYAKEIYPRSPRARATGSVAGNIKAGLVDAGRDFVDIFRYTIVGAKPKSLHTGKEYYYASPVTAVPRALYSLATLDPFKAVEEIANGTDSVVNAGASAVSVVSNAVINPITQGTVGAVASPEAADTTAHWVGAFGQAAAKNLPGVERSFDAYSVDGVIHHNRAFEPIRYTRTDTQLNIDRVMTAVDAAVIANSNDDSSDDDGAADDDGGDDDGGDNGGMDPDDGDNGGMDPGGMDPGDGGGDDDGMMMNPMKKKKKKVIIKKKDKKKVDKKKKFEKKKADKKKIDKKKVDKKKFDKKKFDKKKIDKKKFAKKKGNRSGLFDGTNPGKGKGKSNSPNRGTLNPNKAKRLF